MLAAVEVNIFCWLWDAFCHSPSELSVVLVNQVAEDPVFTRDGADIYVNSNISFTQVRTKSLCKYLSHLKNLTSFRIKKK